MEQCQEDLTGKQMVILRADLLGDLNLAKQPIWGSSLRMCDVQNLDCDGIPVRAQARPNVAESTTSEFGGFVVLPTMPDSPVKSIRLKLRANNDVIGWSLSPV
jgi:hypothetical protein